MRKVTVKLPDGRKLEIEEFDTAIDPKIDAKAYKRLLAEEEAFDRTLAKMATRISDLLDEAERGDRALEYWEAGRVMLDHRRELETKSLEADSPEYEQAGRRGKRLEDKVAEIRRDRGATKERYSRYYLRKFERFADLMAREQASRLVPYSLQHELIYDELNGQDRDVFLDLCERGEVRTNTELRRRVKQVLAERRAGSAVPPSTGETTTFRPKS
jgi:hypothetical protein